MRIKKKEEWRTKAVFIFNKIVQDESHYEGPDLEDQQCSVGDMFCFKLGGNELAFKI